MDLQDLVTFECADRRLLPQVAQAVEWVYSKPEGKEMLEKARTLHGKPVVIYVNRQVQYNSFGEVRDIPVIFVNPELLGQVRLKAEDGTAIPRHSLERFFAHEFVHAAQSNVHSLAFEYTRAKKNIIGAIYSEICQGIPQQNYQKRLMSAHDDDTRLTKIFGEMYDSYIAPHIPTLFQKFLALATQDPAIQDFVKKYEVPAIEFENLMVTRYNGEKPRTTDYVNSAFYEETSADTQKEPFIKSAIDSFHAAVAAAKQSARGKASQRS